MRQSYSRCRTSTVGSLAGRRWTRMNFWRLPLPEHGLAAEPGVKTMALIETILFVVQVLVAIALCGLILLQHGKGADMGAAFGSGSSGSLFGASRAGNFLARTPGGPARRIFPC